LYLRFYEMDVVPVARYTPPKLSKHAISQLKEWLDMNHGWSPRLVAEDSQGRLSMEFIYVPGLGIRSNDVGEEQEGPRAMKKLQVRGNHRFATRYGKKFYFPWATRFRVSVADIEAAYWSFLQAELMEKDVPVFTW
jgi:hypothetical protein